MFCSLKAGGLGLNLTEAIRVIHYDLWFNPAVDSFEEKINATLLAKRELANLTVSAGETWLTELGNSELAALVKR